jgi:hypothetical protein
MGEARALSSAWRGSFFDEAPRGDDKKSKIADWGVSNRRDRSGGVTCASTIIANCRPTICSLSGCIYQIGSDFVDLLGLVN